MQELIPMCDEKLHTQSAGDQIRPAVVLLKQEGTRNELEQKE